MDAWVEQKQRKQKRLQSAEQKDHKNNPLISGYSQLQKSIIKPYIIYDILSSLYALAPEASNAIW